MGVRSFSVTNFYTYLRWGAHENVGSETPDIP